LLTVDQNLYNTEQHLKNILNGKQNENLEYLNHKNFEDNVDFETLKRREFVKQAQKMKSNNPNCAQNGLSMIGSGKLFNPQKIQTIIARDKHFQENHNQNRYTHNPHQERISNHSQHHQRNSSQLNNSLQKRYSAMSNPKEHNDKLFRAQRDSYTQSIASHNDMQDTLNNRRSSSNNPYTQTNQ
jgi:hypothetical protein